MKKTRIFTTITLLFSGMVSSGAYAVDLIDVYKQAFSSDPTFKAARSQWLTDRENLPIKKSTLFPQLGATASYSRADTKTNTSEGSTKAFNNTASYGLTLNQSIFDFGNWASVWQAQAIAKQAEVTFLSAAEDLLLRTATAYFTVLEAKDLLSYARANREALENTLDQIQHKFAVGLVAIVDLEQARADYDSARAKEIAAINDLDNKREKLAEMTGIRYLHLDTLKENYPLLSPQPADMERWVRAAEQQNYDLAAARYASISARENVKIQNAGHLPKISASVNYNYNHNDNNQGFLGFGEDENDRTLTGGVSMSLPIFQGGGVIAAAKQANYKYQTALSQQEKQYRTVISSTRQDYLGVLSNISQIRANAQAIKSAQSSLRATKTGYEVGTQTMVDVLQAQSKLYSSQKDYATSEYNYIIQLLTLKKDTGILDEDDLMQINAWLTKAKAKSVSVISKKVINKKKVKHAKKVTKVRAKVKKVKTAEPKEVYENNSETKKEPVSPVISEGQVEAVTPVATTTKVPDVKVVPAITATKAPNAKVFPTNPVSQENQVIKDSTKDASDEAAMMEMLGSN